MGSYFDSDTGWVDGPDDSKIRTTSVYDEDDGTRASTMWSVFHRTDGRWGMSMTASFSGPAYPEAQTTVRTKPGSWDEREQVMAEIDGLLHILVEDE